MTSHVFISYSHQDSMVARRLLDAFVRARIPVFIDLVELQPGHSLTSSIGDAIQSAKAVLPIISKSSIDSDWVKRELHTCKELGINVIPFQIDAVSWPPQLRLLLGDLLYIDGMRDISYGIGLAAKTVRHLLPSTTYAKQGHYFPLGAPGRSSPHAQCFFGTLESAWDELRFGRTAVVVPTDQSVSLGGRVTISILDHLGLRASSLATERSTISSREVSLLIGQQLDETAPVLIASTVFNSKNEPHAEDQWRSADAVLSCAEQHNCTIVLVPPLGTGSFDWPVRQALINWLYGAIGWYRRNAATTARSVWPVLCVPGPGGQKMMSCYLEDLTQNRLDALRDRKFTIRMMFEGKTGAEMCVPSDTLLGSIALSAFPHLKGTILRFRHGARLIKRSTNKPFDYGANTPLGRTVFADGDLMEAYRLSD